MKYRGDYGSIGLLGTAAFLNPLESVHVHAVIEGGLNCAFFVNTPTGTTEQPCSKGKGPITSKSFRIFDYF